MWANRILLPLASLIALVTLPLVWVSTFVLGLLAQLTFGLILLPLSLVWAAGFLAPLLGTSWLWDRAPILRIPLAVLGVPLALLGSVYAALMPSMGEMESRKQKLNLCWGWPFSLDIFRFETGKVLDSERERLVLDVLGRIEVPAFSFGSRSIPERQSPSPASQPPPFTAWAAQQDDDTSVQDALDSYIARYGAIGRESASEPDELARLRTEVALLKELMDDLGDEAPHELGRLFMMKHSALWGRQQVAEMRRRQAELDERLRGGSAA